MFPPPEYEQRQRCQAIWYRCRGFSVPPVIFFSMCASNCENECKQYFQRKPAKALNSVSMISPNILSQTKNFQEMPVFVQCIEKFQGALTRAFSPFRWFNRQGLRFSYHKKIKETGERSNNYLKTSFEKFLVINFTICHK